jgi:hypothetical protein
VLALPHLIFLVRGEGSSQFKFYLICRAYIRRIRSAVANWPTNWILNQRRLSFACNMTPTPLAIQCLTLDLPLTCDGTYHLLDCLLLAGSIAVVDNVLRKLR